MLQLRRPGRPRLRGREVSRGRGRGEGSRRFGVPARRRAALRHAVRAKLGCTRGRRARRGNVGEHPLADHGAPQARRQSDDGGLSGTSAIDAHQFGMLWILSQPKKDVPRSAPREYAGAVAVAGVTGRRTGDASCRRPPSRSEEEGRQRPAACRGSRLLRSIGVPLYVVDFRGRRRAARCLPGEIEDVSTPLHLLSAVKRLRQDLSEQSVVWLATRCVACAACDAEREVQGSDARESVRGLVRPDLERLLHEREGVADAQQDLGDVLSRREVELLLDDSIASRVRRDRGRLLGRDDGTPFASKTTASPSPRRPRRIDSEQDDGNDDVDGAAGNRDHRRRPALGSVVLNDVGQDERVGRGAFSPESPWRSPSETTRVLRAGGSSPSPGCRCAPCGCRPV